jgi:hypothetical protein
LVALPVPLIQLILSYTLPTLTETESLKHWHCSRLSGVGTTMGSLHNNLSGGFCLFMMMMFVLLYDIYIWFYRYQWVHVNQPWSWNRRAWIRSYVFLYSVYVFFFSACSLSCHVLANNTLCVVLIQRMARYGFVPSRIVSYFCTMKGAHEWIL